MVFGCFRSGLAGDSARTFDSLMPPVNVAPCVTAFMQVSADQRISTRDGSGQMLSARGREWSKMSRFELSLWLNP